MDIIYINVIRNNENVIRVPSVLKDRDDFKLIFNDNNDLISNLLNDGNNYINIVLRRYKFVSISWYNIIHDITRLQY